MTEIARFREVIPAHLTPFDSALEIDEVNLRRHLEQLLAVEGVAGITTTAHASEVATLTQTEQRQLLDIVIEVTDGRVPVIAGVFEDGSAKAAANAARAEAAGADGLLIFPSAVFDFGSQQRPDVAIGHYRTIAEATSLPMIVFLYPDTSPLRIPTATLLRICTEVENVVSVKEWSNSIVTYERNYRALKSLDKEITVLSSFSRSLLASMVVGADGVLSGHGSVVVDLHVQLFRAVQNGDLARARGVWDRISPFAQACFADPFLDSHNRMKQALAILGRIDQAYVRPPLQPIEPAEIAMLRKSLAASGIPELVGSP